MRLPYNSHCYLHSIVIDAHFDTSLGGDGVDFRGDFACVATDNFRAAMRDDCAGHAFFLAPFSCVRTDE